MCPGDFFTSRFHFGKRSPHQLAHTSPSASLGVSWTQTARQNGLFKNTLGSVLKSQELTLTLRVPILHRALGKL